MELLCQDKFSFRQKRADDSMRSSDPYAAGREACPTRGALHCLGGGGRVRVRKAVITAAGQSQRSLPLQTLVADGQEKSVLCILIEQSLAAGVEEIAVVVWPGDESRYKEAAGRHGAALRFV